MYIRGFDGAECDMPKVFEVNFDCLVGPTHNYAGLAFGNLAAMRNKKAPSNPRAAALQGLEKMKGLAILGLKQGVLPPQERPDLGVLRRLGFGGGDAQILEEAYRYDPALLAACCSSSSMWAANAATVSPSPDTNDERIHFTPANLVSFFHRSIETASTTRILKTIFSDQGSFAVHEALPSVLQFADEGAANHTRLCRLHGERGVEIFHYGKEAGGNGEGPGKFPARQTRQASEAIARRHLLEEGRCLFVKQSPEAIDAGAFHNDVVAVGNENVLLYHEKAFADSPRVMEEIRKRFGEFCGENLELIEVKESEVPLAEAISSYLFNSQLVTLPVGSMALVAPMECRENAKVSGFIDRLTGSGSVVRAVHYFDLRQSMQNGGGPACLRLRVVMSEDQMARTTGRVYLSHELSGKLKAWIEKHYRERLELDDLRDPKLLQESRAALDELTGILGLGSIYDFQRAGG